MRGAKRIFAAAAALILVAALTAGCAGGGARDNGSAKKTSGEPEKNSKMEFTGDGGKVEIDSAPAGLPKDWPADVPIYPRGDIQSVIKGGGDDPTLMAVVSVRDNKEEVVEYYKKELRKNDWAFNGNPGGDQGPKITYTAVKKDRTISITVNDDPEDAGRSVLTISVAPK